MNIVNLGGYNLMNIGLGCELGSDSEKYKADYFLKCIDSGKPASSFIDSSNIEDVKKILSSYFGCCQKQIKSNEPFFVEEEVQKVLCWIVYDDFLMRLLGEELKNNYMHTVKMIISVSNAAKAAEKLFDMVVYGNITKLQSLINKKIVRIINGEKKVASGERLTLKCFVALVRAAIDKGLLAQHSSSFLFWFLSKCFRELNQYYYVGLIEHHELVNQLAKTIDVIDNHLTWEESVIQNAVNDGEMLDAQLEVVG